MMLKEMDGYMDGLRWMDCWNEGQRQTEIDGRGIGFRWFFKMQDGHLRLKKRPENSLRKVGFYVGSTAVAHCGKNTNEK